MIILLFLLTLRQQKTQPKSGHPMIQKIEMEMNYQSRIQYSNKYERFRRQMKWAECGRAPDPTLGHRAAPGELCDECCQAWRERIGRRANGPPRQRSGW